MRKLLYCAVVLMVVLAIASCQENKQANIVFERVERMMDEYPDSALAILDSMRKESEGYPRSQRMKFELLCAKAQNKAYVDFTTDSVMKEVVEYYDDHGTPNEQVEAHYLLGCVYRDLKESPMALSCYLDATEKADTLSEDCDYDALMRVWGQIASEYHNQIMPYEEMFAYEIFRKYALMIGDTLNNIVGVEGIADAYLSIKDTLNHIKYINQAHDMCLEYGRKADAARSIPTLISIYLARNDIATAEKYMGIYENESCWFDNKGNISKGHEFYYNTKAQYFESIENFDSAIYYYKKLLDFNYDFYAYKGLVSVYEKTHMADSVIKYSIKKDQKFNESFSGFYTQSMFNAEGMFNYSRNQRIAAEKSIAAERNRINAIIIGVLLVFVVLLFVGFVIKKRREVQNLENVCRAMKEDYLKSLQDYNLMESDFEAYKAMKSEEMDVLEEKWEIATARLFRADRDDVISAVRDNEAIENILQKEKYRFGYTPEITEEEWDDAFVAVKNDFPRFYASVIINPELSDQERKVALLALLGMGTKAIAYMMHSTPSNISNAKTSVNNKLFSGDSAKTLYGNFVNM